MLASSFSISVAAPFSTAVFAGCCCDVVFAALPLVLQSADETLSFLADVASRPEPATLSEYAAMPVEEFGMALLRGMGRKRRANGEVIVIKNPHRPDDDEAQGERRRRELGEGGKKKIRDPNAGYLGIGAKAVKIGVESGSGSANGKVGRGDDGLGAWGKADMRRNHKGEGLYTPVMLRDRRTGELISERELEERKKAAVEATMKKGEVRSGGEREEEEDWRDRRHRNLHPHAARQQQQQQHQHVERKRNGETREKLHGPSSSSKKKMIEYRDEESRYSSSSSNRRRRRSRSRSRSSRSRERYRDADRHRYQDDEYADIHAEGEVDRADKSRVRDRSRSRSRRDRHHHRDDQQRRQQQRYDSASSSSALKGGGGDRSDGGGRGRGRDSKGESERRRWER